jgi:hypothetical protein
VGDRERGKVDGRLVVLLLFGGAFLLWGIVFMTGVHKRQGRGGMLAAGEASTRDSTAHPDSLRAWLRQIPSEWVRVTPVEGQGFVILVPCYSSNSVLTLRQPADSLPQAECAYCDSLGGYSILGMARDRRDSTWELLLDPPVGGIHVLPVTDSLLQRFPETPFQDRILLWIRTRPVANPDTSGTTAQTAAPAVAADTLFFVPRHQENEFEVLRAEDENPEGCVPEAE